MGSVTEDERLDAVFTALGDRTRRDIVARLGAGEATVKELAEPYAMTMQAVSQHRSASTCEPSAARARGGGGDVGA